MCCKLVCMFLQVTMCWDATFWQCKWHFWSEPSDRISSELHGPLQLTERISFWLSFTCPLVWRNESVWVSRSLFTSRAWWVLELSITCPLVWRSESVSDWVSRSLQVMERINSLLTISFQRFWQKLLYFTVATYEWIISPKNVWFCGQKCAWNFSQLDESGLPFFSKEMWYCGWKQTHF